MDMEPIAVSSTIPNLNPASPYMNGYTSHQEILDVNGEVNREVEVEVNGELNGEMEGESEVLASPEEAPSEAYEPELKPITPASPSPAPTYADAFPPLPAGPAPGSGANQSTWGQTKAVNKVKPLSKQILPSNSTQVFKIPYEERKYKNLSPIIGDAERQNDTIRDIMHRTGATIEVSVTKDNCLTVLISGKRDSTIEARRLVVSGLQTQASIEIVIPKEHHRYILGKGGKKLQDLEFASQTKIAIPRDSDIIRIVGTKEGIDTAKHEIQLISDEQAKLAFERLNIPKMYHPFICGPDNEKAKEISGITGARINIPPPSIQKDELTVAGEKESVQKAVNMINEIYINRRKYSKTVSVEVKKSQHRYVIGPRGAGIQEILRLTGVSVEMPSLDSNNETITLRGDADKLGNALTMVYEKANSVVQSELEAPRWLHRFIIGRKGQNIRKITQDNKIQVEFIEDKDKILIQGPPPEVEAAENLLRLSIQELKNTMSYEDIEVDPRWHRHIIGKSGLNIGRIKNETGTSINIPPDTTNSSIIRIEGSPEGVAAAKAEILQMASKMDNEKSRDIIIDHRFHKNIIGQKGEKVREIRDMFPEVQISFPEPGAKSDIVTLRGPKSDVDNCYTYLSKMSEELIAANYKLGVPILKRFHGNVIGRSGATIKKIKEETDVIIDIPAETSDSDVIYITGRKGNAERARDMIMDIQNELANIIVREVTIPQRVHTSLIGQGGKLIQSIMLECGDVNIRFPAEGQKSDTIILRGTNEDVEKAEVQLKKLCEERLENSFTAEVAAKPEHHRFLIGRGGINIRKVREKTGVRIVFPMRTDANQELITIIGKKEAVEEAKEDLLSKIRDLNSIIEGGVDVDPKHHKHFVARRAQVLNDISDEFGGVNISIPKDNTSKITLKGARECVEGARKRLLEIVAELDAMSVLKCVIPQKHHRAILGNKGKNVQELTTKYTVQIKFPDRRRNDEDSPPLEEETLENGEENINDLITIIGNKDRAEEAKKALLALVPVSQTIEIPFENHRYIIGQKGAGIRKMMDEFDVNIAVPPSENKDTVIIVTGPISHVTEALKALRLRNEDIEKENEDRRLRQFELVMNVRADYHPKLIGRRGAVIQKLRDQHGVNIQVPPSSSEADSVQANQIRLIGYEENCTKCMEAIESIIRELEDQLTLKVNINQQVHSRIIGQKGRTVRKLMEQFKVDIRFPREENPNLVLVSGTQDNCEACKEHLLVLEEEYMDEVYERTETRNTMAAYIAPSRSDQPPTDQFGFVVQDAPWSQPFQKKENSSSPNAALVPEFMPNKDNTSDFPVLGGQSGHGVQARAWGPWGGH